MTKTPAAPKPKAPARPKTTAAVKPPEGAPRRPPETKDKPPAAPPETPPAGPVSTADQVAEAGGTAGDLVAPEVDPNAGPNGLAPLPPASTLAQTTHERIKRDPKGQPRKTFSDAELDELSGSIVERGLLAPISVRPDPDAPGDFHIVAGERRWRSIGLAIARGFLPADWPVDISIREIDDAEKRKAAMAENMQRVDLDHMEIALGLDDIRKKDKASVAELAAMCKRTPEFVQGHLRLIKLSKAEQAEVKSGELKYKAALKLIADREGLNRGQAKPAAPSLPATPAAFAPSPKLGLALIELAFEVACSFAQPIDYWGAGYVPLGETYLSKVTELVSSCGMMITWRAGGRPVGTLSIGVTLADRNSWLTAQGFAWQVVDQKAVLAIADPVLATNSVRAARLAAGLTEAIVAALEATDTNATDWLNADRTPPAAEPAVEAEGPTVGGDLPGATIVQSPKPPFDPFAAQLADVRRQMEAEADAPADPDDDDDDAAFADPGEALAAIVQGGDLVEAFEIALTDADDRTVKHLLTYRGTAAQAERLCQAIAEGAIEEIEGTGPNGFYLLLGAED